jgi:hypothetical protein
LAGPCFDQVQEHVSATCLLLRHRLTGLAFSQARVTFESSYRGLWLCHCAADQEVADFQKDKLAKNRTQIIEAIEAIDVYNVGVLSRISKDYWSAMCSYAHGGYLCPLCGESQVREMNRTTAIKSQTSHLFASSLALLAGHKIFEMADRLDLCEAVLARIISLE